MIVEDDPSVSGALASVLESWGFDARRAETFDDILEQFETVKPDLVLMDLNLPERNGFFWTGEIRKFSSVPIIFISSADENMNVITALNQGADDYITKPFDISVLVSKIRALLRRRLTIPPAPIFSNTKASGWIPEAMRSATTAKQSICRKMRQRY